jgi:hypothetical protein
MSVASRLTNCHKILADLASSALRARQPATNILPSRIFVLRPDDIAMPKQECHSGTALPDPGRPAQLYFNGLF